MDSISCKRDSLRTCVYLVALLGLAVVTPVSVAVAQAPGGAIPAEAAIALGEAAARAAYGTVELMDVTPYFDPQMSICVYAIEYAQPQDGSPVTVIASARRDDVPIIMMWRGLAKHKDPEVLARAARQIENALGVVVTEPGTVFWLDIYEVWAQFPETGSALLCNLYTGELTTPAELQKKWQNRQANLQAPASESPASGIRAAGATGQRRTLGTRDRVEYVKAQWAAADNLLATAVQGDPEICIQAAPHYTGYVDGVPNLNEQIPWDGRNWDSDSEVVASMDVVLFWDTRGYDRLVDGADLDAVHGALREAMQWDSGATDVNTAAGLAEFINGASYRNQYAFAVDLYDMWASPPYRWPSFPDLRTEIDSGRPILFGVENYTDDPTNPTDFEYRTHLMCAVGYFEGYPFGGSFSTQWVIVHDNWGGGSATNPYFIDDEPFIDWSRATDSLVRVQPGPRGTAVTYPSASRIVWRCGETHAITWSGFTGSDVKIELYRGSSLERTIAASVGNSGSSAWTVPSTLTPGSDFRVRITSTSNPAQYDFSDDYFTIVDVPQVTYPTAARIVWDRGSSYEITWSGLAGSAVKIELYKGSFLNRTIESSTGNDGSHVWTVPASQATGSDFRIRITSTSDPAQYDESDNDFTIMDVPQVTYPTAAGLVWSRGVSYTITWDGFSGSYVRIDLYQGASLLSTIASSTVNDGSYTWPVPDRHASGSDFRIKVSSSYDSSQYDFSDNPFAIVDVPMVTYPTEPGVSWRIGQSVTITWRGFTGSYVRIELYKGSAPYRTIASAADNIGSYPWTVPSLPDLGADFKIRVTSTSDPSQRDDSDNFFTIAAPRVTYPTDSGVVWKLGESRTITWSGFVGSAVKIELYQGSSLNRTIESSTGNDGSYTWTVPANQATGPDFRVRITATSDASQQDESDNFFTIAEAPRVTYPTDPGVTWRVGQAVTITWRGFLDSYVRIELFKGSSLNRTLESATDNDGSYTWVLPRDQMTGPDFRIRITATRDPSQSDESDNDFAIVDPRVTYPTDPGVTWKAGDVRTITWTGFVGPAVKIELYRGSAWNRTIEASIGNSGSYTWVVPKDQTPGADFKVRITLTSDASQYDDSDSFFTIVNPRVTNPTTTGITWCWNSPAAITWDGFAGPFVTIELYKGSVWHRTIEAATDNDGSYTWTVPTDQVTGPDFRIRVTSTFDPSQSDDSDNDFAISDVCCPLRPIALWRFEPTTFTRDSVGTNTLVNEGVEVEATDRKEGAACANFRANDKAFMSIDDDYLAAGFPTKSGSTDVKVSICFWMKPRTFPYAATILSKYLIATDARSWRLYLGGALDGYLKLGLGSGTGESARDYSFDQPAQRLPKNHWYHVAFTYRASDRRFHIRIWDDTDQVLRVEHEDIATAPLAITNAPLVLGNTPLETMYFDGLLDEVAVFNDVLTTAQIDQIRRGLCKLFNP